MPVSVLIWNEEIINSVTPVKLGTGIAYAITNLKLHDLIESFIQCYIFRFKTYRPGRFPGAHPVTILNRDSHKLLGNKLYSEKLDGTRYLLVALKFITSDQQIPQYMVLLMNRATDMYVLSCLSIPVELAPCALECEMIQPKLNNLYQTHLLVFNIVMTNGKRVNRYRYQERLKICDDFLSRVDLIDDGKENECITKIIRKKQFLPHQISIVYQRAKFGDYPCDGFIVTDNEFEGVLHGSDYNSFKVKDLHTQDVMVGLSTSGNPKLLTVFALGSNKSNDPNEEKEKHVEYQQQELKRFFSSKHYTDTNNPIVRSDPETWKGRIFECEWNKQTHEFYALKARPDKRHANPISILKKTQDSIREGSMNVEQVREYVANEYEKQKNEHLERLSVSKTTIDEQTLIDKRAHQENYLELLDKHSNWQEPYMKTRKEFLEEWTSLDLSYRDLLPDKIPTKEKVLQTLKTTVEKLSVIRLTDPMSQYYDFQRNDVVMVTDGEDDSRNFFVVGVSK